MGVEFTSIEVKQLPWTEVKQSAMQAELPCFGSKQSFHGTSPWKVMSTKDQPCGRSRLRSLTGRTFVCFPKRTSLNLCWGVTIRDASRLPLYGSKQSFHDNSLGSNLNKRLIMWEIVPQELNRSDIFFFPKECTPQLVSRPVTAVTAAAARLSLGGS